MQPLGSTELQLNEGLKLSGNFLYFPQLLFADPWQIKYRYNIIC
jgi:hypothetical protein